MLSSEIKFGKVASVAGQIGYSEGHVNFKTVFENNNGGVSALAFRRGQSLSTHLAPAEVMVMVLEGEIKFTMIDEPHIIKAGEFLLMGNDVPHSVEALTDSKVMLVKIKA